MLSDTIKGALIGRKPHIEMLIEGKTRGCLESLVIGLVGGLKWTSLPS